MPFRLRFPDFRGLAIVVVCQTLSLAQTDPVSDQNITDLVQRLGDAQFAVRAAATEDLIAARGGAIQAVAEALRTSRDIEVQSRCTEILSALATASDAQVAAEASRAIDGIAQDAKATGVRRARQLQGRLVRTRRIEAVHRLRELGAVLNSREEMMWGNRGWVNPFLPGGVRPEADPIDESIVRLVLDDNWQGTADQLALLQRLPEITEVVLDHPQLGSAELQAIAGLPNLTHLVIRGSKIRDDDLALLTGLPQLTTLSIMYVPVTDAAVTVLESWSSLRWLALLGTEITAARLDPMRGKQPNELVIEHKSGAFLGISPLPVAEINRDEGLCLGSITAGGAADRAGLLPGDYLLRFDGHPISDFEDLKARIGAKRPGDSVDLQIRRGDQEQQKKVILGKWSSSDWWIASMQNRFNPLPANRAPVPVVPAPGNP